ncbi:MAG: hypothetical protein HFE81_06345 [Bacilli bacterium]|nr:hypothetical protein [Bacilli bacterium]
MNKEEVENRILICEERERSYREVGNTRIADKYSDEKYKWEELLSKLDSKRDEELRDYKKGYSNLTQALNEIREIINECKMLMPHEFDWEEQADNILKIIDNVLGDEK